jgi:nucleoside-diphosphate-sugar epimerase
MEKTLLIFGYGYSARALARILVPQGWRIIGSSRDPLAEPEGSELVPWPGTDMTGALAQASHLLISIAPNDEGDPVLNTMADDIAASAPHIEWAGYLSTVGVYGDHGGGWVDETAWQALAARSGLPLHIFRLAGIYGPGRGPFAKVRKGTARRIVKPGQVFSRIHVEDIARVLAASIARPDPGRVYNVCDDEAAPPQDVLGYAAELLGLELPPEEDYATAPLTPMARSFYAESKQVRNERIKQELGVRLRFPTYREGLRALLDEEERG